MNRPLGRSAAVNLATNILAGERPSQKGVETLAEAVLEMDAYIKKLDPYGRGVVEAAEEF